MKNDLAVGKNHEADETLNVDILKHLSNTHRSEFQNRKKLEWRIFFAVPTSFAIVTAGVWSSNTTIDHGLIGKVPISIIWFGFIFIAIVTCVLLYCLHLSHEINKYAAHQTENQLQTIYNQVSGLGTGETSSPLKMFKDRYKIFEFEHPARSVKAGPWGLAWECLIIISFAIACAYLVSVKLGH